MRVNNSEFSIPFLFISGCLFVGYLFMLITVISAPNTTPEVQMVATMDRLRREKSQEVHDLQIQVLNLKNQLGGHSFPNSNSELSSITSTTSLLPSNRPGVIILGMHRSGTSIIGGLMNKMGLNTGGPLISPAEDNEKGFFERLDVVLQNDILMRKQEIQYGFNTHLFDTKRAVSDILSQEDSIFREGHRALAFLNDPSNYPWMLKDPRLCITLRAWLPFLSFIPAILFTYRHPMDVALSLHNRAQEQYQIGYGMRMWYVYNKRAIQQSNDLCRVVASHKHAMKSPEIEFARIFNELHLCGVKVPHLLSPEDISTFIDIKLQHGKTTLKEDPCKSNIKTLMPPSTWPTTDPKHLRLYRASMRLYCAMEDRSAFRSDFEFDESIENS